MTNFSLKKALWNSYEKLAYTDKYILGFKYAGNIYITYRESLETSDFVKLDNAGRGQGYSIRFKPSKAEKIHLLKNASVLCSADYFLELVATSKYNKGEIFEKLVTETEAHTEWKKDNVPFTEAGDVEINGTPYQIKFEKATFCNEKSIMNLKKAIA